MLETKRLQTSPFFKGIALFTPGGDLIYCIDHRKQNRWHLQLCLALQEMLGLSEPPHFLVPCYTATIDRWLDPGTGLTQTVGEAYSPVMRYQHLLNAVFNTGDLLWNLRQDELCDPLVIATYYHQFPQLWESHDLVAQIPAIEPEILTELEPILPSRSLSMLPSTLQKSDDLPIVSAKPTPKGYVLRLFVSGHSATTENILKILHEILEKSLGHPYTLRVIDIFKHPEQAENDQISATPTLMRIWPEPIRRIVGEFRDTDTILRLLSISDLQDD